MQCIFLLFACIYVKEKLEWLVHMRLIKIAICREWEEQCKWGQGLEEDLLFCLYVALSSEPHKPIPHIYGNLCENKIPIPPWQKLKGEVEVGPKEMVSPWELCTIFTTLPQIKNYSRINSWLKKKRNEWLLALVRSHVFLSLVQLELSRTSPLDSATDLTMWACPAASRQLFSKRCHSCVVLPWWMVSHILPWHPAYHQASCSPPPFLTPPSTPWNLQVSEIPSPKSFSTWPFPPCSRPLLH